MTEHRFLLPCLATFALAAGMPAGAGAETPPWSLGVSQTFTHENNLYRLADGQATPAGATRSDTVSTTALLAALNQPIGRQRLFGSATLRANRYADNGQLDNEGHALEAGLDWSTVERLSGTVKLGASQSLAEFNADNETSVVTKKNLERTHYADAVVRVGLVTRFTGELGLNHREVDYSAAEFAAREDRRSAVSAGLRYRPSGATVVGAALRHTRGEYPKFEDLGGGNFAADKFSRNDVDLSLEIEPSGASQVQARLSVGKVAYDRATERDFSGVTGALSWTWTPTGKLRVRTIASRDSGQESTRTGTLLSSGFADNSRITTSLGLSADYEVTAKVRINAGASVARRDLVRTLPPSVLLPATATGDDDTTALRLGARWDPTRNLGFGCQATHERRTVSGTLSAPYSARTLGCYGQVFLR